MMDNVVLTRVNRVGILTWLNEKFTKKNGSKFTYSDVQGYTRRGYLPGRLGHFTIEKDKELSHLKVYNITKG